MKVLWMEGRVGTDRRKKTVTRLGEHFVEVAVILVGENGNEQKLTLSVNSRGDYGLVLNNNSDNPLVRGNVKETQNGQ